MLQAGCSEPVSGEPVIAPLYAAGAGAHATAGSCAPSSRDEQPKCLQRPSQLVVLGDSYLNWLTHDFPNDLERALGHGYRMYAEPGASMASGGIATPVPEQLARAIAEDSDILAVILQRRRSAAQELLQRPGRSLREVAEAMGYADAQAFHKAFKRWAGLTPMQYLGARTR